MAKEWDPVRGMLVDDATPPEETPEVLPDSHPLLSRPMHSRRPAPPPPPPPPHPIQSRPVDSRWLRSHPPLPEAPADTLPPPNVRG